LCNYQIRYPSIAGYGDQVKFQILYQKNVDAYVAVAKLNDEINNENLKENLFFFKSTKLDAKEVLLYYPYSVYLTLDITLEEASSEPTFFYFVYNFIKNENDNNETISINDNSDSGKEKTFTVTGNTENKYVEVDATIDSNTWLIIIIVLAVLLLAIICIVIIVWRQMKINEIKLKEI